MALFGSSPFYAHELLRRVDNLKGWVVPTGSWHSHGEDIRALLRPDMECLDIQKSVSLSHQGKVAVWAEPEQGVGARVVKGIGQMLLPGGQLYVIVSGWLARFLPEWKQADWQPVERRAGLWLTTRRLRQAGFRVEGLWGFHCPVSILWGYARHLMARLGRDDLAARCHFKMRAEYVVSGWQTFLSPVGVVVAKGERGQSG